MLQCSALVGNTDIIECLLEAASSVEGLEFGVATDVVAADEDVGDGALAGDVFELVLHISTISDLVKFDDLSLDSLLLKELLGLSSKRAGRLGVDKHLSGLNECFDSGSVG